jgi:glycosyltransferase involved in cell wall biosynthesis
VTPPVVDVVIPALDEALALPDVLAGVRAARGPEWTLRDIVVADNGSTDGTGDIARRLGARVVLEPRRGYGAACLAGLALLRTAPPDLVVFIDADGSDHTEELGELLHPLLAGDADLSIGSRVLGAHAPGAFTPVQRFGNRLAAFLLRVLYGARCTDLGPFRAIHWSALEGLRMRDRDYGWTVEMQARALRAGLRVTEVPVRYRRRAAGRSKVAGTLRGVFGAGWKILFTIARVRLGG